MRSISEPGRRFANKLDDQDQLAGWTDQANPRTHRTTRTVPAEQLDEDRARTLALVTEEDPNPGRCHAKLHELVADLGRQGDEEVGAPAKKRSIRR